MVVDIVVEVVVNVFATHPLGVIVTWNLEGPNLNPCITMAMQ
jgi:hypothetical protein